MSSGTVGRTPFRHASGGSDEQRDLSKMEFLEKYQKQMQEKKKMEEKEERAEEDLVEEEEEMESGIRKFAKNMRRSKFIEDFIPRYGWKDIFGKEHRNFWAKPCANFCNLILENIDLFQHPFVSGIEI